MFQSTIYGIKNCGTVQKALTYLHHKNIEPHFWDYKAQGIDEEHLQKWCEVFGWTKVLNRTGMSWRKASEDDKAKVVDEDSAIKFMLKIPTSIKRPVLETENDLIIGFKEEEYDEFFAE